MEGFEPTTTASQIAYHEPIYLTVTERGRMFATLSRIESETPKESSQEIGSSCACLIPAGVSVNLPPVADGWIRPAS